MDDNDLLLLIQHVDRRSPQSWFDELRVNELGCFFVDVALFSNGLGGITIFDKLFIILFSQVEHNLARDTLRP